MAEFVSGKEVNNNKPTEAKQFQITLNLTQHELDALTVMMGLATGSALKHGAKKLAYSFLRLANELHKNNKKWKPYVIPEDIDVGTET